MTISHSLHHRRAVAAAQRRAPLPLPVAQPQLGFDPDNFPGFGNGDGTGDDNGGRGPGRGRTTSTDNGLTATNDDLPTSMSDVTTSTITTTTTTSPTSTTTSTTTSSTPTTTSTPIQQYTTITPTSTITTSVRPTSSISTSSSSSVPSPTATSLSDTAGTGMSTGAVVGGIGAGIVAIAAVGFGAMWFVRRTRRKKEDAAAFDVKDFRRSAMLLNDPPTHNDVVSRGFNQPPPSIMSEKHTFSAHYPSGAQQFGDYEYGGGMANQAAYQQQYSQEGNNNAGYGAFRSFTPGQVVDPAYPSAAPPVAPYGQSPFSPVSPPSPAGDYYGGQAHYGAQPSYNQAGAAAVSPYPVLTRQTSNGSGGSHSPTSSPNDPRAQYAQRESVPNNDYLDLNRSSVSPFQAAQYAEISKRLNAPVPEGLRTADIEDLPPPLPAKPNPFADPSLPPSPIDGLGNQAQYAARPASGDSFNGSLEFPVPPSPAHTTSSRYRVDSMPPTLPEIHVESRVSYNPQTYDASRGAPSPLGSGFPSGLPPVAMGGGNGNRFPVNPSPLASSFVGTPDAQRTQFGDKNQQEKRKSTHSMYDAEDAYGGI